MSQKLSKRLLGDGAGRHQEATTAHRRAAAPFGQSLMAEQRNLRLIKAAQMFDHVAPYIDRGVCCM